MAFNYRRVKGHEEVLRIFGDWPSFDDFEVISIVLERGGNLTDSEPCLSAELHAFQKEPSDEGSRSKGVSLNFRFTDLENLRLEGFNHQNALNGIQFKEFWCNRLKQQRFSVKFLAGFGVSLELECLAIEAVLKGLESVTGKVVSR